METETETETEAEANGLRVTLRAVPLAMVAETAIHLIIVMGLDG